MRFNYILITLFLSIGFLQVAQASTFIKGPALIEGFTTTVSAAGTTTLTAASETKQIVTGSTTQTIVMPDATTLPLGRKFLVINKSSGTVTVNANGGGLLGTISGGAQAEVHLRVAGSAAGTWDLLSSSAGGGGTWGSITGTLSSQTDLQSALGLKAPAASPTFTGTITTPLITDKALVTNGSGALAASGTSATQVGYLSNLSQDVQTSLDAKTDKSTLTTKGDLYVATASATLARQAVGSNGQMLIADSTQTNGVRWAADPDGNLIPDGNAEFGVTNFVEGSYSAATRPAGTFTSSSGSGTFAISTSTSAPLFGATSFLLTKSSGASRQGRAIERTITIDAGYRTKMLKTRIDYTIVSGTFVAGSNGSSPTDSSLIWYVGQYNGSTWSYTEPSTFKMFSNSTTNSDWVEGEFQVNSDTTQIKLIGFISESANSAWVVKAEVGFRLSTFLASTTITDWVAYTPTITGLGTPASQSFYARRVGDSRQVKFVLTSGTNTAALVSFTLPNNETIDSNKIGGSTVVGKYNASATTWNGAIFKGASNSLVYFGADGTAYPSGYNGNNFANATTFGGYFEVPISGWSSTTQQSDGYDARIVGLFQRKSTGSHTSNGSFQDVTSWDTNATLDIDDLASFNKTTGEYIFKRSGRFKITSSIAFSVLAAGSRASQILYDGVIIGRSADLPGSSTSFVQAKSEGLINAQAGKILKIQARQDSGASLAYATDATQTYLIIEEIKSPTTISATELVAVSLNGSTTTAAGSATTISWLNKTTDTHGAFNSNEFIVPVAGWYIVDLNVRHNGGAGLAVNQISLGYIQIDTGGGYSTVRQGFKFVENTGVASYSNHAHYEEYLKAGTKIRFQHETTIGTPTLAVSGTDTYASIVKK